MGKKLHLQEKEVTLDTLTHSVTNVPSGSENESDICQKYCSEKNSTLCAQCNIRLECWGKKKMNAVQQNVVL